MSNISNLKLFIGFSIDRVIPQIIQIAIHIWLARDLGPAYYAPIALFSLIFQFLLPVFELGISQSFYSRKLFDYQEYINGAKLHTLTTFPFIIFIYLSSIFVPNYDLGFYFSILGLGNSASYLTRVRLSLSGNLKKLLLYQLIIVIISTSSLLIAYGLGWNSINCFKTYIAVNGVILFILFGLIEKGFMIGLPNLTFLKTHFNFGKWITFSSLLNASFEQIITFYTINFVPAIQLGAFSFSRRVASVIGGAIAEPTEKLIFFIGADTKYKKFDFSIKFFVFILLIYVFFNKNLNNLIQLILGSSWNDNSNILLNTIFILGILPFQSQVNAELKIQKLPKLIFFLEVFKKIIIFIFLITLDLHVFYFASSIFLYIIYILLCTIKFNFKFNLILFVLINLLLLWIFLFSL